MLDNNKQSEDLSRLKEEVESLKSQIGEKDGIIEKLVSWNQVLMDK